MASRKRMMDLLLGLFLAVPCGGALAQDQPANPASQQPPNSAAGNPGGAQPQGVEEVAARARTPQNDRVPVSGVEDYRLDGINLGRNFVVGQVQFNELYSTNTNAAGTSSGAKNDSISNLQGKLSLQWLSRNTALDLDYSPSLLVYAQGTFGASVNQQLGVTEKFYMRRWTLLFGDDFSFLPQSPLGLGGYGFGGGGIPGLPGVGGGLTNFNPFFVPGQSIQTIGNRISNVVVGQAQYTMGPRSSINFSGSYGQVHFFKTGFLNSRNLGFQFGYDYAISARQTFTLAYSRSQYYYSAGIPDFASDAVSVGFRRNITGRMSLIGQIGPQFSHSRGTLSGSTTHLSYSARGVIRYQSARNSVDLTYQHGVTDGSGVLPSAQTDQINATLARNLSRNWRGSMSAGFNHNSSLNLTTSAFPNVHFNSWNGGLTASRTLGQNATIQFHYNMARQTSNVSSCINNIPCGSVSLQQQIGMGLTWNSRPYGID